MFAPASIFYQDRWRAFLNQKDMYKETWNRNIKVLKDNPNCDVMWHQSLLLLFCSHWNLVQGCLRHYSDWPFNAELVKYRKIVGLSITDAVTPAIQSCRHSHLIKTISSLLSSLDIKTKLWDSLKVLQNNVALQCSTESFAVFNLRTAFLFIHVE